MLDFKNWKSVGDNVIFFLDFGFWFFTLEILIH